MALIDEQLVQRARAAMVARLTPDQLRQWDAVLAAGAASQRLVPGGVAVGGTAAALYAGHRVSLDVDNLLPDLRWTFDDVMETLESNPAWRTARTKPLVLILGSIDATEIGYRQARRLRPVATLSVATSAGAVTIPTYGELLGMKAYLCYSRNATRDYIDFAALSALSDDDAVVDSLLNLDADYGHLQTASVALEVAKALVAGQPRDHPQVDLVRYKSLVPEWHDWARVATVCRRIGGLFGQRIVGGAK